MNIEITLLIVLHSQEPGGMRMPGEPAITYNFLTCMLSGLTLLTRLQFHSHASQSHPARGTPCMYWCDTMLSRQAPLHDVQDWHRHRIFRRERVHGTSAYRRNALCTLRSMDYCAGMASARVMR